MKKFCLAISCLVLAITSCQKSEKENPCKSNVLRISFMHTPFNLDPRRTTEPVSAAMAFMAFDGLTYLEPDGSVTNSLAEHIDISDDKTVYTFTLRDTKWSDGVPLTAHDFEYSWKTMLDPNFPAACPYLFYPIRGAENAKKGLIPTDEIGVKALDDKTLRVELEHPAPYFLKLIGFCVFFPVPKHIDQTNPNWFQSPDDSLVCNGPFKIQSWQHDSEIRVKKNPLFWDTDQVQLNGLQISIVRDQTTALQMFEQNQLDWMGEPISPLSLDALTTLYKQGKIETLNSSNSIFVAFNVNVKPFDNAKIRKAFSCAIDRQKITDHITQLSEQPATQVFPPLLTNDENKELIPAAAKLDLASELFQQGLDEMGITINQFPKVTLTYPSVEVYKKVGEALQEQWRKAFGINIEADFCEMKVFFDRIQSKNYQVAEAAWWAQYADPMNILERFRYAKGNKNYPGWENSTYISLLEQIEKTKDEKHRYELIRQAENVIVNEVPLTPIYHFHKHHLTKPYVKGITTSTIAITQFRHAYIENNSVQ